MVVVLIAKTKTEGAGNQSHRKKNVPWRTIFFKVRTKATTGSRKPETVQTVYTIFIVAW